MLCVHFLNPDHRALSCGLRYPYKSEHQPGPLYDAAVCMGMAKTHERPLRSASGSRLPPGPWPTPSAKRSSSTFFVRQIHPPLTPCVGCVAGQLILGVNGSVSVFVNCAVLLAFEMGSDFSGARVASLRAGKYVSACDGTNGGKGCTEQGAHDMHGRPHT